MRILLDTHIFLWLIDDSERLSDKFRQAIQNPNNEKFLSVVSIWECVIKHQIGKLDFPSSPETYLPLERRKHLINLPLLHRDPFDRLIISQALQHELVIMTEDKAMLAYSEVEFL